MFECWKYKCWGWMCILKLEEQRTHINISLGQIEDCWNEVVIHYLLIRYKRDCIYICIFLISQCISFQKFLSVLQKFYKSKFFLCYRYLGFYINGPHIETSCQTLIHFWRWFIEQICHFKMLIRYSTKI